jgi:predicted phosphate transport protein (TIGR00153 family)
MFRLLPKEEKYYDLFNRLVSHVTESAQRQQKLFEDFANRIEYADQIKQLEHACDELTHEIIKRLNQTFITPIDREDIHALATGLDDVVDSIDYTARRIILYRVEQPTEHTRKMSDVLVRLAVEMEQTVKALERDSDRVLRGCEMIHTLENEGDSYHHDGIGRLFSEERDPIVIIKMKEIYEKMERTIDKCEDVANVLEAVVLKNA